MQIPGCICRFALGFCKNIKKRTETLYQSFSPFMAEKEGFEPSRQLSHPTPLAGEPLRPLGYFSTPVQFWRRERDSNPRCLSTSLVFKTSALNRSAISPRMKPQKRLYQNAPRLSMAFGQKIGSPRAGGVALGRHGDTRGGRPQSGTPVSRDGEAGVGRVGGYSAASAASSGSTACMACSRYARRSSSLRYKPSV